MKIVSRVSNYLDGKTFSELMNIVIATAKLRFLKTPYKRVRPQFHTIIKGYSGSGKSTILHEVCEQLKLVPVFSLSRAHLLGSVDKNTGILQLPVIWENRNNLVPIDEFSMNPRSDKDKEMMNVLLALMEYPIMKKYVGWRCNDVDLRDEEDDSLYCKVKNGSINFRTRFSLLMTTMFSLKLSYSKDYDRTTNIYKQALISRCIIIPFYPSLEDLKRKALGESYFKFKDIKLKKNIVKLNKKQFKKIVDFVDGHKLEKENYLRTLGDLCRVFAVLGKHNEKIYDLIINLRKVYE